MLLKNMTKKLYSFLLALVMIAGCIFGALPAISAAAEEPSPTFTSYSLSSYSDGTGSEKDTQQHVVLTLTYDKTVTITDETALNNAIFGETPTLEITIAGSSIAGENYYRPCTYKVGEDNKSLIIDIGNRIAEDAPAFTAIYNGSFAVAGSISGISLDGTAVTSDVNIAETRIPTGITLTKVSGWDTNSVTVQVSHEANIRGMYHFALYKVADETTSPVTVVPVTSATGQMNAYTLTSHAHMFYSMSTATLATNIVNVMSAENILPSGYTAAVDGDKITVTSENENDKLRLYIFDDNFIQSKDCALQEPGVSFKTTTASLSGSGSGYYTLNVENEETFDAWANTATVSIDGITFKTVTTEPESYTEDNYAFLEKYTSTRGTSYYLNFSTGALDCPKGQGKTHTVTISSTKFSPVTQEVVINNYAADSFRVRYIDGDGNIITSKAWTMEELKSDFTATTQDYNTVCTMSGVRTFHAQGVLLDDLFAAANIKPDDSMTIQVRTNDSTSQGINDPDDSVGELKEGYYRNGTFEYSDLYAARYYYPSIFYYNNGRKYADLGDQTIYDALKSTNGQLVRDDATQNALREILPSTKDKEKVSPLIAWNYSESVFGSAGNDIIDYKYDTLASAEKSFRFLFGLKEEDGKVSTQTTTWSATYCAFGVDVIAPEDHSVADTEALIKKIGTVTVNSKASIEAARTAYDKLSADAKKAVTNLETLTKAEAAYKKLTEAAQKPEPVKTYTISFDANGGTASKTSVTRNASEKYGALPTCVRKGYTFVGWYTAKTGGTKVSSSTVCTGNAKVYAHWSKVTVKQASKPTVKAGTKKMTVTLKKMSGVKGYQIRYAKKSNMTGAKKVSTTKTTATIKKLSKNTKYYVQVRAYKLDSAKKMVYGSWSKKVSVKVK